MFVREVVDKGLVLGDHGQVVRGFLVERSNGLQQLIVALDRYLVHLFPQALYCGLYLLGEGLVRLVRLSCLGVHVAGELPELRLSSP